MLLKRENLLISNDYFIKLFSPLVVFSIGGLFFFFSCTCSNAKVTPKKDKGFIQKEDNILPVPHLILDSNKKYLHKDQHNFEVFIKNEGDVVANLYEYDLKISLQEEGGGGSSLQYIADKFTVENSWTHESLNLKKIFLLDTIEKNNSTLGIAFKLQAAPGVKKITIKLQLTHQQKSDQSFLLNIYYEDLAPITDAMIQLAQDNSFFFLANTLIKLKKRDEQINLDLRDNTENTPLYYAAQLGDVDIVMALLARGAQPDMAGKYGATPLMCAAERGKVEVVKKLFEAGANLNNNTVWGRTPLMAAIRWGHPDVAKFLIEKLSPDQLLVKDNFDQTPLYFAVKNNQDEVAEKLLKKIDVSQVHESRKIDPVEQNQSINNKENTILLWAIKQEHLALAWSLIDHSPSSLVQEKAMLLGKATRKKENAIALKVIDKLDLAELNKPVPMLHGPAIQWNMLEWAIVMGNVEVAEALFLKGVDYKRTGTVREEIKAINRLMNSF